jgi:hypothetical protein
MEKKKELIETKEVKVKDKKEIYEAPDFYEHKPLESVSATVYYYYVH